MTVRVVLASASPARLATLRAAGIEPEVVVSGVDESGVASSSPGRLAAELAAMKGRAVASRLGPAPVGSRVLVVGCDSVFEVDGVGFGKPGTPEAATERLRAVRGRSGVLHTGHHVTELPSGREASGVESATVTFAKMSDAEIAAYVSTGEPLAVAGAFTIDGLGGAFIERVDGDPHTVVGISLPLLRRLVGDLGVFWPDLWTHR